MTAKTPSPLEAFGQRLRRNLADAAARDRAAKAAKAVAPAPAQEVNSPLEKSPAAPPVARPDALASDKVKPGPAPKTLEHRLAIAVSARNPLDIALCLAEYGWPVFPIRRGSKDQFLNSASDHGATRNPEQIRKHFEGTDHNVGLWAGEEFVMIGPDFYREQCAEQWAPLAECIPELATTFRTKSARGGEHYWFRTRGQKFSCKPIAKHLVTKVALIDVKCGNAYALGPGSYYVDEHGKGGHYELGCANQPLDIPDLLAKHLNYTHRREERADGTPLIEPDQPQAIESGWEIVAKASNFAEGEGRNTAGHALAGQLKRIGISEAQCRRMVSVWNARNAPPLDDAELEKLVNSSYRNGDWAIGEAARGFEAFAEPPAEAAQTEQASIRPTLYVRRDPATIPPREFLYGKHLIRKFMSATVATGGVGKTQLIIAERLAIVTGRPLLGEPAKRGRVWLWNGEDPLEELQRRIEATCLYYDIKPEETEGRLFVDSGRDMPIVIAREERVGLVIAHPVVEAVKAAIKEHQIDVFTVDPFVSCHEVSENDNGAISKVARAWAAIADACNCAIELIHHTRKTGGAEITVEDARGASSLHDAARSMRAMNRMSEDEAGKAGVENRGLYFRSDDAGNKGSMKPPAVGATWYRLHDVGLGNGTMERDEDRVGVVGKWKWPNAFEGLPADYVARIRQAISEGGKWRADPQADRWAGHAIAEVLGLNSKDPRDRERLKEIIKKSLRDRVLEIYEDLDEKRKPKNFVRCRLIPS